MVQGSAQQGPAAGEKKVLKSKYNKRKWEFMAKEQGGWASSGLEIKQKHQG